MPNSKSKAVWAFECLLLRVGRRCVPCLLSGLTYSLMHAQGTGLGEQGRGIAAPLESRLRPKGMGIGHEGFAERTASAVAEAKRCVRLPSMRRGCKLTMHRRGVQMSDDEDEKAAKQKSRRRDGSPSTRAQAWKQAKAKKPKTEFKTYEEILAASGETQQVDGGLGQIVDLTGAEVRLPLSLFLRHGLICPTAAFTCLDADHLRPAHLRRFSPTRTASQLAPHNRFSEGRA